MAEKHGLGLLPLPQGASVALVLWRMLDPADAQAVRATAGPGVCSRPDCVVAFMPGGGSLQFLPAELATLRPLTYAEQSDLLAGLDRAPAGNSPSDKPASPAFVHQVLPRLERWLAWMAPQGFVTVAAVLRLGGLATGYDVETADGSTLRALPSQLRPIWPNLTSGGAAA